MAEVKNYGLSGVHRTLQLGKQGPVLVGNADTDSFSVTLQDGATLTNMGGANATSGTHFITKSQLDAVYTEATFLANVNYNDSSPILLGNISYGTKTIITTFEVTTAFDDPGAVVTVGDSSDNSLLMSDNYAEIEVPGTYQTVNVVEFANDSTLNIYITQGGATQGFGTVLVSVVDGPVVNGGAINYGSGSSGIALTDLSVLSNSPSGNGSLTYNSSTGVFTFTPADASLSNYSDTNVVNLLGSFGSNSISTTGNVTGGYFIGNGSQLTGITAGTNYSDSNVVTLLSSFGSNTLVTTGNVTAGNITTAAGKNVYLGNASSLLRQLGSNSYISLNQNVTLTPDTTASPTSGVLIGGSGYLLGPNGGRNLTLNFSATTGWVGVQSNLTVGSAGTGGTTHTPGNATTGITSIVAGVTNTLLPNTIASFSANVNNYTQVTLQNKSSGADATADFIITADNGNDTTNYADFGIINSGYDNTTPSNSLGNIVYAADTYLYAQGNTSNVSQPGGNIAIGTTVAGKTVKIFAGGANANSIVGTFSSTGLAVNGNVTATNFSGNISITGNVTGTSPNVSLVAGSYTATFDNTGVLTLPAVGGNEGGEINFGIPTANTTLVDRVKLDVYQDRVRIFDGSTKGVYIDLSQAATGVGTLLNNRVSGFVNAGTYLTMDNLKATISTSGNRSLQIAAVSGSFAAYVSAAYTLFGGGVAGTGASITVTTTPALALNWNFTAQGDVATYIISDTTNSRAYRVTMMIGGSYNNNMISIERLI